MNIGIMNPGILGHHPAIRQPCKGIEAGGDATAMHKSKANRMIAKIGTGLLVMVAAAYLAVMAILFVFQERFIFPAPQEVETPGPGFETITLTTSDGLDLDAHYRAAEVTENGARPTIVWFHGNGGSLASSAYETRVLAAQGYGLLLVSYRGYAGNPGEPSESGFYRDGRSALDFVRARGVPDDRTIIAGNSIGSGTAVQMAGEYSPAALILVAPFTSLTDAASDAVPIFPVKYLLRHKFDSARKLPALEMPILVLHGTADRVVPFDQGRRLAGTNSGARFIRFEGAGHDLSAWEEAQTAQAEWLEKLDLGSVGFGRAETP